MSHKPTITNALPILLANMSGGQMSQGANSPSNGSQTQNASGSITIPMKGTRAVTSLTLPDPDDAESIFGLVPLRDVDGAIVTSDKRWTFAVSIDFPDGAPSVNDNVIFGLAICNENGVTGATIDGVIIAVEYSLANTNPRVRSFTWINGTVGNGANGTAAASVQGVSGIARKSVTGGGTTGVLELGRTSTAMDSSRIPISGSGVISGGTVTSIGTGQWYACVFAIRTLAADTDNITPSPRFRLGPITQLN